MSEQVTHQDDEPHADESHTNVDATPVAKPPRNALAWLDRPWGKLGLIGLLLLLLQWPLSMVSGLIAERQGRQEEVTLELARDWGSAQRVQGPILVVPVTRTPLNPTPGMPAARMAAWLRIPASQLDVSAQLQTEKRRRGLFQATVYTAAVELDGVFKMPALPQSPEYALDVAWTQAVLQLNATDLRGQPGESPAQVGGQPQVQTLQEIDGSCPRVVVPAGLSGPPEPGTVLPFQTHLTLRGTRGLSVMALGRHVSVRMAASSATPGFTGPNPPLHYSTGPKGFQADWQLVGTAPVTDWQMDWFATSICGGGKAESVGVELLQPMPTYLMVTRAAKYGTLFLVLGFLTYFLFERLARVSIHVVQYALLGLSVSLFALLLVAVAEPLGFVVGYVVATAAVMGQASLYTLSVVGSRRLAATFAAVLGSLFGFLYVVISLESYALLLGAVGVFVALSVLMAVTRRLDWGGAGRRAEV